MNVHPAAPYAGMTQTGSMGLISAASAAAPQAEYSHHRRFSPTGQARPGAADGTGTTSAVVAAPSNASVGSKGTLADVRAMPQVDRADHADQHDDDAGRDQRRAHA